MKKVLLLSILLLSTALVQSNIEDIMLGMPKNSSFHHVSIKGTAELLEKNLEKNTINTCVHFLFPPTDENPNYSMSVQCGISLTPEEYKKYMAALLAIEIKKADMAALLAIEIKKADDEKKDTDTKDIENENQPQES